MVNIQQGEITGKLWLQVVVFLGVATASDFLFVGLKVPKIVGLIVKGVILGPSVSGFVAIIMRFMIGLVSTGGNPSTLSGIEALFDPRVGAPKEEKNPSGELVIDPNDDRLLHVVIDSRRRRSEERG